MFPTMLSWSYPIIDLDRLRALLNNECKACVEQRSFCYKFAAFLPQKASVGVAAFTYFPNILLTVQPITAFIYIFLRFLSPVYFLTTVLSNLFVLPVCNSTSYNH
jgi:hypothetical protein